MNSPKINSPELVQGIKLELDEQSKQRLIMAVGGTIRCSFPNHQVQGIFFIEIQSYPGRSVVFIYYK